MREDEGLKILNDLEEMKKDIEENIYTSDDARKKKFLNDIEKINEMVLLDFLDKDMYYYEELSKLRREFNEIKIEDLNYEELNDRICERDEENLKIEKKIAGMGERHGKGRAMHLENSPETKDETRFTLLVEGIFKTQYQVIYGDQVNAKASTV